MIKTVIFIGCLCVCIKSYTQEVRIKLENCKLEPAALAEIKNSLQFQLALHAVIFNDKTQNTFKARVFGTQKEFQKYSKSQANFNPLRNEFIAFYSPTLNEMILHTEVQDFTTTFAHEMSHAILNYYCKNMQSTWLDEGLAELVEDIIVSDTAYVFDSRQVNKIKRAELLFRNGASVKNAVNSSDFYKSPDDQNYTLAWATVTYLYRVDSQLLFKMIAADCLNRVDFIDLNYPGGLDVLESDVKSFFLNNKPGPN